MKRLDKRGFTLIELLAVIVILAIVVGITMVTVLPTLKDSKQKAFNISAEIAADYLEKQYQLQLIGESSEEVPIPTSMDSITTDGFIAAGLKPTNYWYNGDSTGQTYKNGSKWKIDEETGKACVKLLRSTEGDYKGVNPYVICSSACTTTDCEQIP